MSRTETPSPCGIVCKTCVHLANGCAGCYDGGGEENCHIRDCTTAERIPGCWQCADFPCDHFKDLDAAWQGLAIGFIELVQEIGEDRFARLALKNIGEYVDYGDLRFKSVEQAKDLVKKGI